MSDVAQPPRVASLPSSGPAGRGVRTFIRGGTVVSATGATAMDVLVDGETVAALVEPGTTGLGADLAASADRVIDARAKLVVPGGVDVHTHMELPFGGTVASDTFESGTRAAAFGGTTTVVDFAVQRHGERVGDGLAAWHDKAAGHCAVDYGFHMILGGVDDDALAAMDTLVEREGISSFKLFMAYPGVFYSDDGQILRAMQRAAETGALVMMHAENGMAIDVLVAQALARGETGPIHHSLTRPPELEGEATHRAVMLAKVGGGPPLNVVHQSSSEARAGVGAARPPAAAPRAPPARPTSAPPRCAPSTGRTTATSGAACGSTTCRWCRRTTAPSA